MRVFYMVDCQEDFMNPDGALYVPGADGIRKNIGKLYQYAAKNDIPAYGSVDRHFKRELGSNREFMDPPRGDGFPPHCMDGTKGQRVINEARSSNAIYVPNNKWNNSWKRKIADAEQAYFEKQSYDVFPNSRNPGGNCWIDDVLLGKYIPEKVDESIISGVATDICVQAAVLGQLDRDIDVYLVKDAMKGLGGESKAMSRMKSKGAKVVSLNDVLRGRA